MSFPQVINTPTAAFNSTGNSGFGGTITLPLTVTILKPAEAAIGTLLLAIVTVKGYFPGVGAHINPCDIPTGWTLVADSADLTDARIIVLAKTADGTEPANLIFSYSGPAYNYSGFTLNATVLVLSNADNTTPIDIAQGSAEQSNQGASIIPGITTTLPNDLVIVVGEPSNPFANSGGAGLIIPGDPALMTALVKANANTGLTDSLAVWMQTFTGPGPIGPFVSATGWPVGRQNTIQLVMGIMLGTGGPTPPPPPPGGFPAGDLIGLTFNEEQNVIGWHRHPLIGSVESIACIPSPDQSQDELWMIVNRTINGVTKRYIEYMGPHFVTDDDIADAVYVDSATTYDGPATTMVKGLDHLEGQTVKILADGSTHPDLVVTGGMITLDREASVVQVGLAQSCRAVTMPLEAGRQDGSAQGKIKRISGAQFRLLNTLGGKAGRLDYESDPNEEDASITDDFEMRVPADPMDEPVPVFSGLFPRDGYDFNWPAGYEVDGRLGYENDDPFPATIVGIYPIITVED